MFKTIALVAAIAFVALAQLPPAPIKFVWEGMYPPPYIQSPQIALAMDCVSKDLCYLAGGSNGVGFGVYKYDGKMEGTISKMMEPNMSMFVTDLAVGGTLTDPKGAFSSIVDFTIGKGLQYLANGGTEWLPSKMPEEIVWASESITGSNGAKDIVAIGNGFTNDLMISSNYGKDFSPKPLTYKNSDNCSYPSYIETPSEGAWFMSWAAEPAQNNNNAKYFDASFEEIVQKKANGQVLVIRNKKTGHFRVHTKTLKQLRADRIEAAIEATKDKNPCNYYDGYILKSVDQGKTWTQVYHIPAAATSFLSCYSATSCVVTAFNADESYTITTTNGNDFKITYTSPAATKVSMEAVQAVGFASETEVWAAGSMESQSSGAGLFWSSNDKGETWTAYPHEVPDVMAIMAVDFADGVGFAVGITMFKTAQIMRYKKQADYGYFVQSHCPIKGCSILCQNVSFPQGMCLEAQGGSAKAFCTPQGVVQYMYETTSCVDGYKTHTQPINQCLNGTNSFFENYCPSSMDEVQKTSRPATKDDKFRM